MKVGRRLGTDVAKQGGKSLFSGAPSHARSPQSEGAFQDYRAGERSNFGPSGGPAVTGNVPFPGLGAPGPDFSGVMNMGTPVPGGFDPSSIGGAQYSQLGSSGAGAGVSPGASTTGGFSAGGLGAGLASAGIGAAYGMGPGLIAKGLGADPQTVAITNAIAGAAAPAATGATAGALGLTAGGAAGGLAAAAPAYMVVGPYIVGKAIDMVKDMQDAASAEKAAKRASGLASSIPGHVAAFQKAPQLLQQLQNVKDPAQAAQIYQQLEQIQTDFQNSGMENFLKTGLTTGSGSDSGGLGGGKQAKFEQGPAIMEALKPYGQALNVGRIRATDIAANAGQPIPGARGIADYGLTMGTPEANDAIRPGAGIQSGQLAEFLGMSGTGGFNPLAGSREGMTALGAAGRDLGEAAGPDLLKYAGLPEGHTATVGDIFNYMEAGGAGKGRADQFGQTDFGYTHMPSFQEMSKIQPGNYEKGLADFFGSRGGMQAGLDQYGFGTGSLPDAGGVGGVPQGGAGKRQTPFLTPELDNRAEAAAGKLGGGRQETGDPGTPFGMSGKRGGGMGVGGAPQRQGGRPGGNAPFGGMARQTMMPQGGRGVQARRPGQQGVV